jgi:hypothetical protein
MLNNEYKKKLSTLFGRNSTRDTSEYNVDRAVQPHVPKGVPYVVFSPNAFDYNCLYTP